MIEEGELYQRAIDAERTGTRLDTETFRFVTAGTWSLMQFLLVLAYPDEVLVVFSANGTQFNLRGSGRVTTHEVTITSR